MEFMQSMFPGFFDILLRMEMIDIVVVLVNIILMVFARRIIGLIYHEDSNDRSRQNRVHILRILNIFIIVAFTYYQVYLSGDSEKGYGLKLVSIFVVIYMGYLIAHISEYFIRQKFGRIREVDGQKKIIETYNSRLLSLFSGAFIFVIVLIAVIRILEFDSLLEAGGVIGFIGVFFALTQNAWAPDIFSGLIILNSGMVEEGDVIELSEGADFLGVVFKTKMFHTEILNMVNNHRVMIKNSKLREYMIHNLSKFASAKGLRENLHFKVSYDVKTQDVRDMFEQAYELASEEQGIYVESQFPLDISVVDAGDHAVEWGVFYYTKDVKNILKTRQNFIELILNTSKEKSISLATPMTYQRKEG